MNYEYQKIRDTADALLRRIAADPDQGNKRSILGGPELRSLFDEIKLLPAEERPKYGQEINRLRGELEAAFAALETSREDASRPAIDVTAPFDLNVSLEQQPRLLSSEYGTRHPLMTELDHVLDIFYRMGFTAVESRQIDDDYHMFGALNFPEGHPARDDYDTFMTEEGLIAPAHTSTMQNRVLRQYRANLENDQPIAVVIPGRVFRNEDLDARHEHTFHQLEGVYVGKGIHAGHLIATLKTFLQEYYQKELGGKELEVKTQSFYFPFTEPSFEFSLGCPFCNKEGCSICGYAGWIELLGCGMIHPNVLRAADIDPVVYTGFAWGGGIERLVMMKHNIEDIRHFESGKLDFLRQFK
jgi:phenylalanyl-tRNA synthetase alpha chain